NAIVIEQRIIHIEEEDSFRISCHVRFIQPGESSRFRSVLLALGFARSKPVPDPGLREDVAWGFTRFDFLTKLIDQDSQAFGLLNIFSTPDRMKEYSMGENFS